MAHRAAKDIYRSLGKKLDGMATRAPWSDTLHAILEELYTPEEAEFLTRMPNTPATIDQIGAITGSNGTELQGRLDRMCEKGLVLDLWIDGQYRYMPLPMVVGFFEMAMMRTGDDLNQAEWAELFNSYLHETDLFYATNATPGKVVSVLRTLPHEESVLPEQQVEILDYERAHAIVDQAHIMAVGICSCRHEKMHVGEKQCDTPMQTCSSFGHVAEYLIRHKMARQITKAEMHDNLSLSKELKLVLTADNVQRNVGFLCQCCSCCCNLLLGITRHGYPNTVVTSTYLAQCDLEKCSGCEKCAKTCPIGAIEMVRPPGADQRTPRQPVIDQSICLGCGVCGLTCHKDAIHLAKREQRVLHPETTFERILLGSLEQGTLQNHLFAHPDQLNHQIMRAFLGGFLRLPPVKQALLSEQLRSTFLSTAKSIIRLQDKSWLLDI
jgi:formate hydrogenlyase subunit 6/NADH:ubiquinone oxidoreductase subunit I